MHGIGNMRDVFMQCERMVDVMTKRHERQGRFEAEIVPDCSPKWHVLLIEPGHERIAAAHLVGRRFGTYLPMLEETKITRGRKRQAKYPIFPGYLFIFVWDIEHHLRRIKACTGVSGVLYSGSVPAEVPDKIMERIQVVENSMCPLTMTVETVSKPKRRWRRSIKSALEKSEVGVDPNEVVSVRCFSAFRDIDMLDDAGRNQALHKALGLAS